MIDLVNEWIDQNKNATQIEQCNNGSESNLNPFTNEMNQTDGRKQDHDHDHSI